MPLKTSYLLTYNLVSLLAWTYLTARVLLYRITPTTNTILSLLLPPSPPSLPSLLTNITILQTAAALEVLHAALGIVGSSLRATALQVGGRNLVVWTVMRRFPEVVLGSEAGRREFVGCLLVWGAMDVLRYAFFVAKLGSSPGSDSDSDSVGRVIMEELKWFRYDASIVLYFFFFRSEVALVYLALVQGTGMGPLYRGYLFLGLLATFPAMYFLYRYTFAQRRRALGQAERVKRA